MVALPKPPSSAVDDDSPDGTGRLAGAHGEATWIVQPTEENRREALLERLPEVVTE